MTVTEPILVMAFNRPDHLRVLLDRLREVQPERLYVAVDGPRVERAADAAAVAACRDLVSSIDWPCSVSTLFQGANLGCGLGVTTAITWFFSSEERGIILEDDVIPDPSFFGFCAELLDRYASDPRVFSISGCSLVPASELTAPSHAYRFSQVPNIWGWATWRRSWAGHRLDARGWWKRVSPRQLWASSGRSLAGASFWATNMELTARGEIDTWDWQLMFEAIRTGALVATPNVNLVSNIGFGEGATHTTGSGPVIPPVESIALPTSPVPVVADARADAWMREHVYQMSVLGSIDRLRQFALSRRGRA